MFVSPHLISSHVLLNLQTFYFHPFLPCKSTSQVPPKPFSNTNVSCETLATSHLPSALKLKHTYASNTTRHIRIRFRFRHTSYRIEPDRHTAVLHCTPRLTSFRRHRYRTALHRCHALHMCVVSYVRHIHISSRRVYVYVPLGRTLTPVYFCFCLGEGGACAPCGLRGSGSRSFEERRGEA